MRGRLIMGAAAGTVTASLVGSLLVPSPVEQVTMLARDKRYEDALVAAGKFVDSDRGGPGVLMLDFQLNERYGDLARAKRSLRAYLEQRPDDMHGWRKAARLYGNAHRLDPLLEALERLHALTGDGQAGDQLARLYRLHGRAQDELRILRQLDLSGMDEARVRRLASLMLARGQAADAAAVLRNADDRAILSENGRIILFDTLLALGRATEAVDRARVWIDGAPRAYLHSVLVAYLLRAQAKEAAVALASHARQLSHPAVFTHVLRVFAREGHFDLLRRLVREWLVPAEKLSPEQLDAFLAGVVAVAMDHGLAGELFGGLIRAIEQEVRPGVLASLAEALHERLGPAAIAPYPGLMAPHVLSANPLFAAKLLLSQNARFAARDYLLRADLTSLSEPRARQWLDLAGQLVPRGALVDELAARARSRTLPAVLARAGMALAVEDGRPAQARQLWAALSGPHDRPAP